MKLLMPIIVLAVTLALLAAGLWTQGQLGATIGVVSGSALPGLLSTARTPEQAIALLLEDVRKRNWSAAHAQLANAAELDESIFQQDLAGNNGSLRTLSGLETWTLRPLRATNDQAQVRATLRWSTPVGPIDDIRDLQVVWQGQIWKVVWPKPRLPEVLAQVIPVNYLRWDLVTAGSNDGWGERNLDAPRVRIISMNVISFDEGTVVMGEVVNEDTVPAFVNVNATLLDAAAQPLEEESSFDKIVHVLLPKQVSPYRIDFPNVNLQKVKNVKMDVKSTLVPAAADPVIGVMGQKLETEQSGKKVLRGQLLNQSGQMVNIPHVIATFYDDNGRVIWVADGYVDRALYPQAPEPFAVEIPATMADKVQNYHVVVNQYSQGQS